MSQGLKGLFDKAETSCLQMKDKLLFEEKSELLKLLLPWLGMIIIAILDRYLILKGKSIFMRVLDKLIGLSSGVQIITGFIQKLQKIKGK